jgi:hypothetical protein
VIQPHAVADDLHREAVTLVQRRRHGIYERKDGPPPTEQPNTQPRQPDNADLRQGLRRRRSPRLDGFSAPTPHPLPFPTHIDRTDPK